MRIFGIDISRKRTELDGSFHERNIGDEFGELLQKWDYARQTLSGEFRCASPQVDPFVVAALADSNGFHTAALYLKNASVVGQGYECSDALREHIAYANDDQTFEDFLEELSIDLEEQGNGYVEVRRDKRTAAFYRSPALITRIRPTGNGSEKQFVQFNYTFGGPFQAVAFDDYRRGDVRGMRQIHLARRGSERWYGTPEYMSAKRLLTTNLSIVTLAEKWFKNGLFLDKMFVYKGGNLSATQKQQLRSFISRTLSGVDNANKSLLLEIARQAELEIKDLSVNMKESHFGNLRNENTIEIAAAHRLPSAKLIGMPSAGQLGASDEIDGLFRLFAMTFVRSRQNKWNTFLRRLFRDAGLPDADSFKLIELDTTAGVADAQMLSAATGGQPWLSPEEARQEWFGDNDTFSPKGAAAFVQFLNWIERNRRKL